MADLEATAARLRQSREELKKRRSQLLELQQSSSSREKSGPRTSGLAAGVVAQSLRSGDVGATYAESDDGTARGVSRRQPASSREPADHVPDFGTASSSRAAGVAYAVSIGEKVARGGGAHIGNAGARSAAGAGTLVSASAAGGQTGESGSQDGVHLKNAPTSNVDRGLRAGLGKQGGADSYQSSVLETHRASVASLPGFSSPPVPTGAMSGSAGTSSRLLDSSNAVTSTVTFGSATPRIVLEADSGTSSAVGSRRQSAVAASSPSLLKGWSASVGAPAQEHTNVGLGSRVGFAEGLRREGNVTALRPKAVLEKKVTMLEDDSDMSSAMSSRRESCSAASLANPMSRSGVGGQGAVPNVAPGALASSTAATGLVASGRDAIEGADGDTGANSFFNIQLGVNSIFGLEPEEDSEPETGMVAVGGSYSVSAAQRGTVLSTSQSDTDQSDAHGRGAPPTFGTEGSSTSALMHNDVAVASSRVSVSESMSIDVLMSQLRFLQAEVDKLRSERDEIARRLGDHLKSCPGKHDAALRSQVEKLRQEKEELARMLRDQAQATTEAHTAELLDLRAEIDQLKIEKAEFARRLAEQTREDQEAGDAALRSQVEQLLQEKEELTQTLKEQTSATKSARTAKVQKLQTEIENVTAERDDLARRLAEQASVGQEASDAALRSQVEQLFQEKEELARTLKEQSSETKGARTAKVQKLQTEVEKVTAERDDLACRLAEQTSVGQEASDAALRAQVEQLLQQKEELARNLKEQTSETKSARAAKLQKLQTEVEKITAERDDLVRRLAEQTNVGQDAGDGALRAQVGQLLQEKEDLAQTLREQAEAASNAHTAELLVLQTEIEHLKAEKNEVVRRLAEQTRAEQVAADAALQSQVDQLLQEKEELARTLKEQTSASKLARTAKLQKLQTELEQAKVESDQLLQEKEELTKIMREQTQAMTVLQTDIENAEAERDDLARQLTEQTSAGKEAKDALECQVERLLNEKEEIERMMEEQTQVSATEIERLTSERDDLARRLEEETKAVQEASDAALRSHVEELLQDKDELAKKLKKQTQATTVLQAEVEELKAGRDEFVRMLREEARADQEASEAALRSQVEGLAQEKEELVTMMMERTQALTGLQTEVAQLEAERDEVVRKLAGQTMSDPGANDAGLRTQVGTLLQEREELAMRLGQQTDAATAQVQALQQEMEQVRVERDDLVRRLEQQVAENQKARDAVLGSQVGEVLGESANVCRASEENDVPAPALQGESQPDPRAILVELLARKAHDIQQDPAFDERQRQTEMERQEQQRQLQLQEGERIARQILFDVRRGGFSQRSGFVLRRASLDDVRNMHVCFSAWICCTRTSASALQQHRRDQLEAQLRSGAQDVQEMRARLMDIEAQEQQCSVERDAAVQKLYQLRCQQLQLKEAASRRRAKREEADMQRYSFMTWAACVRVHPSEVRRQREEDATRYQMEIERLTLKFDTLQARLDAQECGSSDNEEHVHRLEDENWQLLHRLEQEQRQHRILRREMAATLEAKLTEGKRSALRKVCFATWRQHTAAIKGSQRAEKVLKRAYTRQLLSQIVDLWRMIVVHDLQASPGTTLPVAGHRVANVESRHKECLERHLREAAARRARLVDSLDREAVAMTRLVLLQRAFAAFQHHREVCQATRCRIRHDDKLTLLFDSLERDEKDCVSPEFGHPLAHAIGAESSQLSPARQVPREAQRLRQERLEQLSVSRAERKCEGEDLDDEDADEDLGLEPWAAVAGRNGWEFRRALGCVRERRLELDEHRPDASVTTASAVTDMVLLDLLCAVTTIWRRHARASAILRRRKQHQSDLVQQAERLGSVHWEPPLLAPRSCEFSPRSGIRAVSAIDEDSALQLQRNRVVIRQQTLDYAREFSKDTTRNSFSTRGTVSLSQALPRNSRDRLSLIEHAFKNLIWRDLLLLCVNAWQSHMLTASTARIAEQIRSRHSAGIRQACDQYGEGLDRLDTVCSWVLLAPPPYEGLASSPAGIALLQVACLLEKWPLDELRDEIDRRSEHRLLRNSVCSWRWMVTVAKTNRCRAHMVVQCEEEIRQLERQRVEDLERLEHIEREPWVSSAERLGLHLRARIAEVRLLPATIAEGSRSIGARYADAVRFYDATFWHEIVHRCVLAWHTHVPVAAARRLRERTRERIERDTARQTDGLQQLLDEHPLVLNESWFSTAVDRAVQRLKLIAPGASWISAASMQSLEYTLEQRFDCRLHCFAAWRLLAKRCLDHAQRLQRHRADEVNYICATRFCSTLQRVILSRCLVGWREVRVCEDGKRKLSALDRRYEEDLVVLNTLFSESMQLTLTGQGSARESLVCCLVAWRFTALRLSTARQLVNDDEQHRLELQRLQEQYQEQLADAHAREQVVAGARKVWEGAETRVANLKREKLGALEKHQHEEIEHRKACDARDHALQGMEQAKVEVVGLQEHVAQLSRALEELQNRNQLLVQDQVDTEAMREDIDKLSRVVQNLEQENKALRETASGASEMPRRKEQAEVLALDMDPLEDRNEVIEEDVEVIELGRVFSPPDVMDERELQDGPQNSVGDGLRGSAVEAATLALRAKLEAERRAAELERRADEAERRASGLEAMLRTKVPSPARSPISPGLRAEPAPEPSATSQQIESMAAIVDELQAENKRLHERVLQRSMAESEQWMDAMVHLVEELRRENAALHLKTLHWRPPRSQHGKERSGSKKLVSKQDELRGDARRQYKDDLRGDGRRSDDKQRRRRSSSGRCAHNETHIIRSRLHVDALRDRHLMTQPSMMPLVAALQ